MAPSGGRPGALLDLLKALRGLSWAVLMPSGPCWGTQGIVWSGTAPTHVEAHNVNFTIVFPPSFRVTRPRVGHLCVALYTGNRMEWDCIDSC